MPDILEFDQVRAMLRAAIREDQRDWLMLAVTFIHALRASETVALTPVNIVGTRISCPRRKGSRPVDDALQESAMAEFNEAEALIALARATPRNQRIFPITTRTLQRRVHHYGDLAGLPAEWCHPHTLKHSILDHLHKTGMDLVQIQDRSGHVGLDSLRVYLHPKKIVTDALVNARLAGSI